MNYLITGAIAGMACAVSLPLAALLALAGVILSAGVEP